MHKLTLAAIALAIGSVAFTPVAFAQGEQPLTRAEVKSETRALEKAGQLTPAGEGSPVGPEKNFKSTKTRADRKAETKLAAKNHELTPAGSAGQFKADAALRAQPTQRSRPERKAETRLAQKNRQLTPAGEGQDAPRH
jgi:hypothetical protein